MQTDKTKDDATQDEAASGGVGDVESAGETTAAVAISGPVDDRPVGADTLVKVADEPAKPASDND